MLNCPQCYEDEDDVYMRDEDLQQSPSEREILSLALSTPESFSLTSEQILALRSVALGLQSALIDLSAALQKEKLLRDLSGLDEVSIPAIEDAVAGAASATMDARLNAVAD